MENDVRERIDVVDKKIEELKSKIRELENERKELSKELKGWFIGNSYCGTGAGDYWDEFLHPLGLITEDEARKWAEENNDEWSIDDYWPGSVPAYYEVPEDEYDLYIEWQRLRKARRCLTYNKYLSIERSIDSKIYEIVSQLSNENIREYLGFVHIYCEG